MPTLSLEGDARMRVLKTKRTVRTALAVSILTCAALWQSSHVLASGPLASAARMDDLDTARQLIASGMDINLPEPDGTTPLLWAVYNNSPALVHMLLDAGADPNIANALNISPLLQASRYGNADMIKALLEKGARLDLTAGKTEPVLMAAARSGSADAINALLYAGANPNNREPIEDQTAIMWATAEGHLDAVRTLLDAGADPNLQARVNTLTERKNADFPSGGFAPLHWATRNGDEDMIQLLLDHGANINATNGDNATPMMLAIVNDRLDLAASLLEHGADANDGSLLYATEMRDATTDWRAQDGTVFRADHPNQLNALDLTRLLLEAGADPNKPFIGQMHNASMCCDLKSNMTPFYRASKAADIEGMRMMLEHGADPNWKPASESRYVTIGVEEEIASRSALMMATTGGKGVGVDGGPNDLRYGPPPYREEGERDPAKAARLLLEAGADPNVVGPDGITALHVAARALNPDIIRALVEKGANLNAENDEGKTPYQLVENMERPKATPGFYFATPPAWPEEVAALLKELAGDA